MNCAHRERARLARIEAHRLKAEHARLVAAVEDAAADRLVSRLDDPTAAPIEITTTPKVSTRTVAAEQKAVHPALCDSAPLNHKKRRGPKSHPGHSPHHER